MYTELQETVFKRIDELLLRLSTSVNGEFLNYYGHGTEGQIAKNQCDQYGLISYRTPGHKLSKVDITPAGTKVLQTGGFARYLEQLAEQEETKEKKALLETERMKSAISVLQGQVLGYEKLLQKLQRTSIIAITALIIALAILTIQLFSRFVPFFSEHVSK